MEVQPFSVSRFGLFTGFKLGKSAVEEFQEIFHIQVVGFGWHQRNAFGIQQNIIGLCIYIEPADLKVGVFFAYGFLNLAIVS